MTKLKKPKQFEPADQIETAFAELQKAMLEARSAIDRVEWLKDRLLESVKKADEFNIYTEDQAAEIFGVTTRMFRDFRAQHNFPHIAFGMPPKYTLEHLQEIAAILSAGTTRSRAAGLHAAA